MPTEQPHMPNETYESMLRRGASKGLGVQAFEVAYVSKKSKAMTVLVSCVTTLIVVAISIGFLSSRNP